MLSYSYSPGDPGEQQVPVVASDSNGSEDVSATITTDAASEQKSSPSVVGSCWSPVSASGSDLLFGVPCILLGIAMIIGGFLNPNAKPGEETATLVVCCLFGGLLVLCGLFIMLSNKFSKKCGLEATTEGISFITKRQEATYRWDEIEKVVVGQFTATRKSNTELFLSLEPTKGKAFSVRSNFEGESDLVIQQILTHCDYIVRNPESYNKNNK